MQQVIHRLEAIHRALRNAPKSYRCDPRVAESVAICLRELHAIAAQSSWDNGGSGHRLRLIDCRAHQGSGITTQ
jgi:hypothetical protein